MALASFVASTQFWRLLEMARPTTCSELPFEYASAVSIKLMPASRAFATIRVDVASSVGPPNIMVPRHIGEIFRPLRDRKSTRLNSSHSPSSYAVFCLKKKKKPAFVRRPHPNKPTQQPGSQPNGHD